MPASIFDQKILPLFEEKRAIYIADARFIAMKIAKRQPSLTIDDVRAECPPPQGIDPRVMGGVLRGLERQGFLVAVGYETGSRSTSHNRPIMRYRLPS